MPIFERLKPELIIGVIMENWKKDRIGSAQRGENPTVMVKMKSGFAVIGDVQFLPGYCVLLSDSQANSLNSLSLEERKNYLLDMTLIGDAIIKVCNPLRINYSTLMNLDHYLHTHIEARYNWEPDENIKRPTYFYPKEHRSKEEFQYSDEKFGKLKDDIANMIKDLMKENY